MMKLFQGCFSPRTAPEKPPKTKAQAERGVLKDRWDQYDQLSKEEDTWRQKAQEPIAGVIQLNEQDPKETKEPPLARNFSKNGLQETWNFYQETQGPQNLEHLAQDGRQGVLDFIAAAADGNMRVLEGLLNQPAVAKHINITDDGNRTALILAVEGNHPEAVSMLMKAGADINHTVAEDDTPLHLAIRYSHHAVALLLIQHGSITINAKNEDGWTPLHEACCLGDAEIAEALLRHGADAQARCRDGTTPLHKAARAGNKAVIALLLRAGADDSAVDKHGLEPMDCAVNEAIADLLSNSEGSGSFHSAAPFNAPSADSGSQEMPKTPRTPRTPRTPKQVNVVSEQARRAYEARWQQFQSETRTGKTDVKLAYIDIPWPAEEFASNDELIQVVFACAIGAIEWKRRLRGELLRWHPDKFQGSYGALLLEADRERIMHRVQAICEVLNSANHAPMKTN